MHEVTAKGILSAQNGMNIYRGCTHGCIYCDSRSKCYQLNHKFEDIEVKVNAPELLEQVLSKKRKKSMILTGAMTDPYILLELKLQNMRKCLQIIEQYKFGVSIQTKSSMILRDLELLKRIHKKSKCVVQMTLTTYDETLCKIIEPNVSSTKERFEVLKIMKDEKIPTIVWLTPILPFINDSLENIQGILEYCIEAKVKGILCFNFGLTLREGNREYFYLKLDQHFKGMKEIYQNYYGTAYEIISPRNKELKKELERICSKYNIMFRTDEIFSYLHQYESNDYQQLNFNL